MTDMVKQILEEVCSPVMRLRFGGPITHALVRKIQASMTSKYEVDLSPKAKCARDMREGHKASTRQRYYAFPY